MKQIVIALIAGMIFFPAVRADQLEDSIKQQAEEVLAAKRDLSFSNEPKEFGVFTNYRNSILKPTNKGDGPFPALVLLHTCGGILDRATRQWIEAALKEGYAVTVVDSMRGNRTNCDVPWPVSTARRVKDAYDALALLSKQSFVDPKRIAVVGFSQGGAISMLSGTRNMVTLFSPSGRFAAAAGVYPLCFIPAKFAKVDLEYLRADLEIPLLVLLGEDDVELPAQDCVPLLEKLRAQKLPVDWHIYPKATHCWDCSDLHNYTRKTYRGTPVTYRYDAEIAADSRVRLFEFLAKSMGPAR